MGARHIGSIDGNSSREPKIFGLGASHLEYLVLVIGHLSHGTCSHIGVCLGGNHFGDFDFLTAGFTHRSMIPRRRIAMQRRRMGIAQFFGERLMNNKTNFS